MGVITARLSNYADSIQTPRRGCPYRKPETAVRDRRERMNERC